MIKQNKNSHKSKAFMSQCSKNGKIVQQQMYEFPTLQKINTLAFEVNNESFPYCTVLWILEHSVSPLQSIQRMNEIYSTSSMNLPT